MVISKRETRTGETDAAESLMSLFSPLPPVQGSVAPFGNRMDEIKKTLAPLTDSLPPSVRDFLDSGGWWVVIGVTALILLLLIWGIADRLLRRLFRRRVRWGDWNKELDEDLATYPSPAQPPGNQRLTVYHLPVRLRLVVLAPAGTETQVNLENVNQFLDQVVPGLAAIAASDRPRVRAWPPQLSQQGFAIAFQRHTRRPEAQGQPSHWLLVAGRVQFGRQSTLLGLALWMDQPTTLNPVVLEPHQWLDVLRIKVA